MVVGLKYRFYKTRKRELGIKLGLVSIIQVIQPLIVRSMFLFLIYGIYRTIIKKDEAAGLATYISLVIVIDIYMRIAVPIPGLESGSIRYSEIWFSILYYTFYRNRAKPKKSNLDKYVIIYFLLFSIAALRGYTLFDGIFNFRETFVYQIIAYYIASKAKFEEESFKRFILYISVFMIYAGLIVFWDKFYEINLLKTPYLSHSIYYVARKQNRFGSFFNNANIYGSFIVLIFFNLVINLNKEKIIWKKIIVLNGIMLSIFGLIMTQSRGAMIGLLCGGIIFLLLPSKSYGKIKRVCLPKLFSTCTINFNAWIL